MAKAKDEALPEVAVPGSGDALDAANAQAKLIAKVEPTDTTNAKEVVEFNGTTIVRW